MIDEELCRRTLEKYGENAQLDMVVEECSELIQAVQKYKRWKRRLGIGDISGMPYGRDRADRSIDIIEESVDVEFMLTQVRMMFRYPVLWKMARTEKEEKVRKKLEASIDD